MAGSMERRGPARQKMNLSSLTNSTPIKAKNKSGIKKKTTEKISQKKKKEKYNLQSDR